ncbi:MAG: ROK family protein [Chloroflexi bacterium]|nr:MAG: ROK family protein [Chloroflexota bacterium]
MDAGAAQPVLAIDLGGTQIRAAHVAPDLTVSLRRAVPTNGAEGPDAVIGRICAIAAEVRADAARAGLAEPIGIGISSPGPLDPWQGVVVLPPNLPGWVDIPLADRVQQKLGMPTFLERDTNVAMMAEWRYGSARNADDAIYITVSTGIGGGIIARGNPLQGPDNTAGEVGHLTIDMDGPLCGDGMQGHAEAIGSGTAIARDGRLLLELGESPILADLAAGGREVDAALVAAAADAGDAACRAIYERAYVAVGVLCASLVNALNPQVIVIGGSIAEHHPELRDVARGEIDRRAFPGPARRVRIMSPRFTEDVSLIGSLPIVNERMSDPAYRRASSSTALPPLGTDAASDGHSGASTSSAERVGGHAQLEEPR